MQILNQIQQKLKAPKSQYNSFGKYSYRNCEDILEAVKPLLGTHTLIITDEVVSIGNRYYVKATAQIFDEAGVAVSKPVSAYAREAEEQKGMNDAQITGSASSYARKYALNGLLLIDDTKDDDTREPNIKVKAEPKMLTVYEQAEKAISQVNTLTKLSKLVENINKSTKLSKKEIEDLNAQASFKSQELTQ